MTQWWIHWILRPKILSVTWTTPSWMRFEMISSTSYSFGSFPASFSDPSSVSSAPSMPASPLPNSSSKVFLFPLSPSGGCWIFDFLSTDSCTAGEWKQSTPGSRLMLLSRRRFFEVPVRLLLRDFVDRGVVLDKEWFELPSSACSNIMAVFAIVKSYNFHAVPWTTPRALLRNLAPKQKQKDSIEGDSKMIQENAQARTSQSIDWLVTGPSLYQQAKE